MWECRDVKMKGRRSLGRGSVGCGSEGYGSVGCGRECSVWEGV